MILKKLCCLLILTILMSCYDYNFNEVKVRGQVYFVLSEGIPDNYTLEFKESETNYRPLITDKISILTDSGSDIYVATAQSPSKYYKLDPTKADSVKPISESEFLANERKCKHCTSVIVPQP
jgi:hypothetical protein